MISREEVEHVARLARLRFAEDELARLQPELGQIIDYVRQLAELDLSGLEPTSHAVPLKNVLRPDVVLFEEMLPRDAYRACDDAVNACDLFMAVGTSCTVHPAGC